MRRLLAALLAASLVAATAGCTGGITGAAASPKVKPPAVAKAGVLRAAIDLGYPPFGGVQGGAKAGLDIDVAAAIASQLGLSLEIVDATAATGTVLVKDRQADISLGALTVETAVAGDVSFAGTYVSDAPALYSTKSTTATIDDLAGKHVAVQKDSYAYWVILDEYGEDALAPMPTLHDAMFAAAAGQYDYCAGDAIVASYIQRDFPNLRFNGQLTPAYPLGVAVSKENPQLEEQVRQVLDDLAAKGVLATLRRKWAGDLPTLASANPDASTGSTATPTATVAP